ncbi:iron(III) transport system substrate-binding protein [Streptosporangium becharense]|uniref:Iron(III) transport system substrate-binding protein n=1 Tax=Streptosporangium becharense TaxID=1816182 RepID=A0A7W9IJX7_9ACTN|nr:iron ABC transporter substrate-binding protein [Streptosporangium becharense]MBB2913929.1 iron(III) transport system substrate-binding protein [Streptosporangium becharense]MBB5821409.1 iron(III) transport system substrate-binding protein [Streptosporangium becharense]
MSLHRLVAAALLPLALLASACGGGGDGAEDFGDDSLVIYSGRNENLVGPLLDKLKTATGLDVQVRYGDSAELAAQILEEGADTRADLFFSQDAGALGALSAKQMLAPVPQDLLGRVPAEYRGVDGTWVGVSGRSRVVVYDPRTVTAPPKSVFELTDPKWRGKVGWAPTNASFQSFVTAMRVVSGEDKARQWLEAMKANGTQTYPNNVEILNAVDAGKLQLGLINHYYWYEKVAEKGAGGVPSKLAYLPGGDPGALVNVAGVATLKNSKHAEAARKATDYLLGPDAQKYFAETTKEYPLIAGVATAPGLPPLDSLKGPEVDLSKLDSLEQTITLLQDVGLV